MLPASSPTAAHCAAMPCAAVSSRRRNSPRRSLSHCSNADDRASRPSSSTPPCRSMASASAPGDPSRISARKLRHVALDDGCIERNGPAITMQRRGAGCGEAPPQTGQRLAQARSCELRIRVLPEEARQPIPRMLDSGFERQATEERLGLARGDADLAARRRPNVHATQQLYMEFSHAQFPLACRPDGPVRGFSRFFHACRDIPLTPRA